MKTSLRPQDISTTTLHTLSTSLLLLSSMEVQAWPAEETVQPWYGRAQSDNLNTAFIGSDPASGKSPALFTLRNDSGHTQRVGLISGQNQIISTGSGLLVTPAMAEPGKDALNLTGSSLGAYWSLTGPAGWHVDLSASGGRVNGYSRTEQGQRQASEGNAVTLSVEGGFPIGIGTHWVVEPQAQLINQRITLDTPTAESGTSNELSSWSGRVGARLKGNYQVNGLGMEPYVRTNLWHTVQSADTLSLDKVDKISSSRKSSTVEVGLGLVARVTPAVSLYVSADYSSDVDDNDLNGIITSMGVRMRW
ncbi:autotransporter outer membrane beta-barrel domain-containing protein [Pseudomonas ogarae]|uniref:autotransporter domain-containing protein n=1 Tax=Pseudomonas ogarae (strain DSM 112162 / CECT 30235 / F113) TaxID=1114970 RepID=UPI0009A3B28C|nr:autotransporter outer membrane beta-barrel domain-containing protein [Pseudomonas ogarae]OPG72184.1 autotransporter outer membrane beta-barrel domain-containing protein [Pseudomonas ogarae]OPG75941.1 autotransporter outer membrane beta-barrel domain-containing protein [Pseudomonas ogarae]PBJ10275.1 Autotransporter beta-domain protein [Pseudomonas ogarae]PBJ22660.1 Autotransporter beta-domain protein [Pseudomonas ogarae]